jgi:AcrR family transcriptional regulator
VPRAEREQSMLDAAGRAFAAHGFHAASMDAIAEAAGISKPMLYNYFRSKDGLYIAYVERSGQALMTALRGAARPQEPARARLEAGVLAFFTYVDEHREGWAVLYNEAAMQGGPVAAEVAAMRSRLADMVAGAFPAEKGLWSASPAARAAFAHAFVGAGESLANWWLAHPEQGKRDIARLLLRVADAGLTPVEGDDRGARA